jgi:kynureninase
MEAGFRPAPGAEAWQLSNPPILAMAPLRASLGLFRQAGMEQLRAKSLAMTGWLADALQNELGEWLEFLSPANPERRGCQLSLRVRSRPGHDGAAGRTLHAYLEQHGVVSDWREPDIIRVAPVPLYNSYADCAEFRGQGGGGR